MKLSDSVAGRSLLDAGERSDRRSLLSAAIFSAAVGNGVIIPK